MSTELAFEQQVMKKMAWRLMPLLIVMFLISFIDRQNVGSAKLEMVHALGMTEASYGLGASLFFIGYLLFEVPSTLALHRFGARAWLARIMMTWGVVTVLMAFARSLPVFYLFRFALGVAEAGFYPGVIYYLTQWFPQSYRTKVLGFFTLGSSLANMLGSSLANMLGSSLANMLGSLIGGLLLTLGGTWGFAGWQWVFIATGLPAVIVAFVALRYLPNSVSDAPFLSQQEKDVVIAALKREAADNAKATHPWAALLDPKVLMFAATYMLMSTSLYGVLNMIPWALATLLLLWLPGKLKRERVVLKAMSVVAGIGVVCFASSLVLPTATLRCASAGRAFLCCIRASGRCCRTFSRARAAASVAAINAIGNLGGFAGQNLMPYVGKAAHSQIAPMLVPTACLLTLGVGTGIAALIGARRRMSLEAAALRSD
ncbi:MAG: Uncharacterized MFS-type transporter [uncultured Paraburkholderia sp.]|nr:MAG: Uncharacterized MFS-type transporter [uncultured Paraburkholderia sp.]